MENINKVLCKVLWAVLLIAGLLYQSFAVAESVSGGESSERKATSAELAFVEGFEPTPGTYHYDVFLKGAKLGRATIAVDRTGDEYTVAVTARTRGILKHLYKVKYRGEVKVTREPLVPTSAVITERTGDKKKIIQAEFPSPDKIIAVEQESRGGGPTTEKTKEYDSESFILDPFSTVYLIRSLEWEIGTDEVFDVFTGNKQYEINLLCTEESVVTVDGVPRNSWVIVPETRTITKPQKVKLSGFSIYLSKDDRREILKIVGNPKVGRIVANLRKFQARSQPLDK